MKKYVTALILGATLMVSACGTPGLEAYKDSEPPIAIREYFTGHIRGWGMVQDRSGKVTRRFEVLLHGQWNGNDGTLEEHFSYYDGEKQQRVWHIHQLADGTFEGTAADIIGKATGSESGSAIRWNYTMDVTANGSTYRLDFDDWMFRMKDGVVMNRSYLKKFGVRVAEITIFLQKQ